MSRDQDARSQRKTVDSAENSARKAAMAAFASASAADLRKLGEAVPAPIEAEMLRGPETGLVTVRGRIGGGGAPFNTGEATVTRATVRLANGQVGHAYALGRDKEKVAAGRHPRRDVVRRRRPAPPSRRRSSRRSAEGRPKPTPCGAPRPPPRKSISSPWCAEKTDGRIPQQRRAHRRRFRPIRSSMPRRCSVRSWTRWRGQARYSRPRLWPSRRCRFHLSPRPSR